MLKCFKKYLLSPIGQQYLEQILCNRTKPQSSPLGPVRVNLFVFQPGLLGNFPGPFEEEMKGIAAVTDIPLGKVHFVAVKKFNKALENFSLEVWSTCSKPRRS